LDVGIDDDQPVFAGRMFRVRVDEKYGVKTLGGGTAELLHKIVIRRLRDDLPTQFDVYIGL
jgi:hypothetical protein